jgi:hypothetical protein
MGVKLHISEVADEMLIYFYDSEDLAALTLLVSRIVTDDHDLAMATNHLAVVTDPLDTRLYLHGSTSAKIGLVSVHL